MPQITAEKIQNGLPIAAVERETGISKDTLRVWEKRYGFPQPMRDAFNERIYPNAQIQRLKLIQRLLNYGHRPHKVANLSEAALKELLEAGHKNTKQQREAFNDIQRDVAAMIVAIKNHDEHTLRAELQHRFMRMGLKALIIEFVAPLITAIGDAWQQGHIEVFEEHFATQIIISFLRHCIASLPPESTQSHPKVLLTTIPQEQHSLGLIMVEALLGLEGCQCVALGTQTPIQDIAYAAKAFRSDVVALSFTGQHNASLIRSILQALRQEIPAEISIWVGGSNSALYQSTIKGITALNDLNGLKQLVQAWQQLHGPITPPKINHT